ncbi:MAG: hypothetical protein PF487_05790 [Bacteroidales bacterium]|jgi:uncharacterized protein YaiE (UPF0345 family)|nr:hypothetical protein [Bacteroidales bacterium]
MKWTRIAQIVELKNLCSENENAVGVTKPGELYIYNFETNKPEKINVQTAMERLEVDSDTMAQIIKTGGKFQLEIPAEEIIKQEIEEELEQNQEEETPSEEPEEEVQVIQEEEPQVTLEVIYELLQEILAKL